MCWGVWVVTEVMVLWVFGWEVTWKKIHSPLAPGKGNRTSEMARGGTCAFLFSLSSDPTSSSTIIVLGSLMKCGESLIQPPSQHSLQLHAGPAFLSPLLRPKESVRLPLKRHFSQAGQCSVTACPQTPSLQPQTGQFSRGPSPFFLAYEALIWLTEVLKSSGNPSDNLDVPPRAQC